MFIMEAMGVNKVTEKEQSKDLRAELRTLGD